MKPNDDPIKYLHSTDASQKFSFKQMSDEAMVMFLKRLKSRKTPGPDTVPTHLFKDTAKFSAKLLAMIFKLSWQKESFLTSGNSQN